MALLLSNDIKVDKPARRLYHGKYVYRASLQYPHVTLLRKPLTEIKLDYMIDQRNHHIKEAQRELSMGTVGLMSTIWADQPNIDGDMRNDLIAFYTWLTNNNVEYSVVAGNGGFSMPRQPCKLTIFTSNDDLVNEFFQFTGECKIIAYCHNIPGEIRVNNRKGTKRQFFRQIKTGDETKKVMTNFFDTYKGQVFPSPATINYFKSQTRREIGPTYFFDYSDDKIITVLSIIAPDIIGPRYTLVSD